MASRAINASIIENKIEIIFGNVRVFLYIRSELRKTKTPMTLVRIITAETIEDIDFNNLGNHFTVEGNEPEIANKLSFLSADASEGNLFYVYIETDSINTRATEISNENHPSEKEVVTNENSEVQVLEVLDDSFQVVASNLSANTGNRTHEWAK